MEGGGAKSQKNGVCVGKQGAYWVGGGGGGGRGQPRDGDKQGAAHAEEAKWKAGRGRIKRKRSAVQERVAGGRVERSWEGIYICPLMGVC